MARRKFNIDMHNFKNGKLENDNIYINPRLESVYDLINNNKENKIAVRKGLELFLTVDSTNPANPEETRTIISNVSNDYGFLPNEKFYPEIEQRLEAAGISVQKRSINRANRSFTVDYILNDENMHLNIKKGNDLIKPLIRVVNSYDGSNQTTGHFGFFRQICSNGLHVAESELKFNIRHRGDMMEIVMPKIEELLTAFMDNEYYSLHRKFEVLAEKSISDIEGFVRYTLGQTGLFKYEKSEKNPEEASVGAQFVIDIIEAEAKELKTAPNLWLGYNAFNEYIHTQSARPFVVQEATDRKLFDAILAQVN